MTAIAWSLVGLMAASLGVLSAALFAGLSRFDALGAKIDGQGSSLGTRIDAQGAALGARIDAQGAALGARIDAQGAELRREIGALRDAIVTLDRRLTRAGG